MRDGLAALLVMLAAGLAPALRQAQGGEHGRTAAAPPAPPANAAAQKPSPPGESQKVAAMPTPKMYFGDATRHGRPFAKDPSVIRLGGRYLMYYSMAPSSDPKAPEGWAVGPSAGSGR
ncbi:MAG: hypothetical protein NTX40_00050 [Planctomycetota bacterium]|nr:hypothetical protein [Planctomycetota bacterium]